MTEIPIRLVFHFYTTDNLWSDSNILHYVCLKKYAHIFNEVIINISIDDIENYSLISRVETYFASIGFPKKLQFNIIKNDSGRREVETFDNEVYKKLNSLEGITFFGHNKGTTNNFTDSVKYWIASVYYFNLENLDDVKKHLLEYNACLFYGANPTKSTVEDELLGEQAWNSRYRWVFTGTFYWLNTKRVARYIDIHNLHPLMDNRWAAENFVGELVELPSKYVKYPMRYYGINMFYWYDNTFEYLKSMVALENLESFNSFYNNLLIEIEDTKAKLNF